VRLDSVLFPIDSVRLIEALSHMSFEILAKPPPITQVPFKATARVSGDIARKGDSIVSVNPVQQILSVTAMSVAGAQQVFSELEHALNKELEIGIEDMAKFFELLATYQLDSNSSPVDCIGRVLSQAGIIAELGNILGQEVSPFTLRLVSKGKVPNQEDWIDIEIEPLITRPTKTYLVSVICRSNEKSKVLSFAKELEPKIIALADLIEKQ